MTDNIDYTRTRQGLRPTYTSVDDKIGVYSFLGKFTTGYATISGAHADSHFPWGDDPIPIAEADVSPGLMSGPDKAKIDGISYVRKPVNLSPEDGATNVAVNPTLSASNFYSIYGSEHAATEWMYSKNQAFTEDVTTVISGEPTTSVIPAENLDSNEQYYFTVRYTDSEGDKSPWSDSTTFTTGSGEYFDHGPGPGEESLNYDESTDTGYYGEVSSNDLISGNDLATDIGYSSGTAKNSTGGWLKFYSHGKVLFVAKKPFRTDVTWDSIYNVGAVFGTGDNGPTGAGGTWGSGTVSQDSTVVIDGKTYKVRLLTGSHANPWDDGVIGSTCADDPGGGSEWNKLIYRIHSDVPNCSTDSNPNTSHGGPQVGVNWASMSNGDIIVGSGDGRYTWCQESVDQSKHLRISRGATRVQGFAVLASDDGATAYGWRPCLELVQ